MSTGERFPTHSRAGANSEEKGFNDQQWVLLGLCLEMGTDMTDCLFCRIAAGEIPANLVFSDDRVVAFEDIAPQAPTHIIVIPRRHIPTLLDISDKDQDLIGYMHTVINKIAHEKSLSEDGFRLVTNCKKSAGQEVFHIHIHMLGGRSFGWPPG